MSPHRSHTETSNPAGGVPLHINDLRFYFRAKRLVRMRDFLLQEGIKIDPALRIDDLSRLSYRPFGDPVSDQQWHRSEDLLSLLSSLLPPGSRSRFRATDALYDIIVLGVVGVIMLVMSLYRAAWVWYRSSDFTPDQTFNNNFFYYTVWVVVLGFLGSLSFIIINALLVTNDAKFDISNRKFVYMRLLLGVILSSVIAFPFTWYPYRDFVDYLGMTEPDANLNFTDDLGNIMRIMLPFILGFSTTFGISILTIASRLLSKIVAGTGTA